MHIAWLMITSKIACLGRDLSRIQIFSSRLISSSVPFFSLIRTGQAILLISQESPNLLSVLLCHVSFRNTLLIVLGWIKWRNGFNVVDRCGLCRTDTCVSTQRKHIFSKLIPGSDPIFAGQPPLLIWTGQSYLAKWDFWQKARCCESAWSYSTSWICF